jgi:gamma-butyrobetaine dioxygenase
MMDGEGPPSPRLLDAGAAVAVPLADGERRFHAIWLRDNAAAARTAAGQKLVTLLDIPADTRIVEAAWRDGRLRVVFQPGDEAAEFDPAWLSAHAYDRAAAAASPPAWTGPEIERWDALRAADIPVALYGSLRQDPAALQAFLADVRRFGFARLAGLSTKPGAVEDLVALFGFVRETNYGRVFDVRAEVEPGNLAYTELGLQAHTDNPYRDPPPSLQVLACLANSAGGGESVVVDGFAVVARLAAEDLRGFALLSTRCARFDYAAEAEVRLRAKAPLIELGPDGELLAVRFNNRSAAPLVDTPFDEMADYYGAYRRFAELIEDPALAFRFKLAPGEAFVVDNRRVLHGRTAFTGEGGRWLQGCYADRDGLLSTLRALEEE